MYRCTVYTDFKFRYRWHLATDCASNVHVRRLSTLYGNGCNTGTLTRQQCTAHFLVVGNNYNLATNPGVLTSGKWAEVPTWGTGLGISQKKGIQPVYSSD